jgi:Phytanoyl-CoA dioxygenase (PhyH)
MPWMMRCIGTASGSRGRGSVAVHVFQLRRQFSGKLSALVMPPSSGRSPDDRSGQFHASWFDEQPQTSSSTTVPQFDDSVAAQMAAYQSQGFTIIKRGVNQDINDLEALNRDILARLADATDRPWYNSSLYSTLRYFNLGYRVRSSEKRHALPLAMTDLLSRVVRAAVLEGHPFLRTQLSLVDLSSIISLPGAERQKTHSDIPYSSGSHDHIMSGFVALSRIHMASGPTCLFAGSHTKAFHDRHVDNAIFESSHYSVDGSLDDESGIDAVRADGGTEISTVSQSSHQLTSIKPNDSAAVDITASSAPHAAILDVGDLLLYDTKLFHFGGANTSNAPRALLMFSFQQCTPWGSIDKVSGFTYHCHDSVEGKFVLGDFGCPQS